MRTQYFKQQLFTALFFIVLCVPMAFKAQDKLVLTSGDEQVVTIVSVTGAEIKYRLYNQPEGPLRVVPNADVFMIRYSDGSKEVFTKEFNSASPVNARTNPLNDTNVFVPNRNQEYSGPRFGITYISPGTLANKLSDMGKQPVVTQLGWQFEWRMFTTRKGASGVVEAIPMLGGMEQGTLLPSASLLVGMRGSNSVEFALGPNLSLSGLGMVFAAGMNFRTDNINIPVNLAFVPSVGTKRSSYDPVTQKTTSHIEKTGFKICLTVGFNMRRK